MKFPLLLLLVIPSIGILFFKYFSRAPVPICDYSKIHHMGIIMDGNRRWAREHGMPSSIGHKEGVGPLKTTIRFCLKHHIPYLTVYAFSLENLKRSQEELDYLFKVLAKELTGKELDTFIEKGIQIRVVGDPSYYPDELKETIAQAEEKTKEGKNLILSILFCYGGQQEIIDAAKKIAHDVKKNRVQPEEINSSLFTKYTWFGEIPHPDIVIRTGKAQRLSNFLTYQSAYSEIYFLPLFWPEVTEKHLENVCEKFCKTNRTFGG